MKKILILLLLLPGFIQAQTMKVKLKQIEPVTLQSVLMAGKTYDMLVTNGTDRIFGYGSADARAWIRGTNTLGVNYGVGWAFWVHGGISTDTFLSLNLLSSGQVQMPYLTGIGTRMVVTDDQGRISSQALPSPITIGTANGLSLSGQALSLSLASSSTPGALSASDWNAFNNKQNALGFTPENVNNKVTTLASANNTTYPTSLAVSNAIASITIPGPSSYIANQFSSAQTGDMWISGNIRTTALANAGVLKATAFGTVAAADPNIDFDPSSTNELQVLSKVGSTVTLSGGGGSFIDDNTTYTGSTSVALTGGSFQRAALSGDVTALANSNITSITNLAVTNAKINDVAWSKITGVPSTFTPAAHTHAAADVVSGTLDIARIPTGTTNTTVALGNDSRINNGQTAFLWGNHAGLYATASGSYPLDILSTTGSGFDLFRMQKTGRIPLYGYSDVGGSGIANASGFTGSTLYLNGTTLDVYSAGSSIFRVSGTGIDVSGSITQSSVTSSLLKADATGKIVPAIPGVDYPDSINITSGTYTPTFSAITGVTGVAAVGTALYSRAGNIVTVSGIASVTFPTGTAASGSFEMSLPINSDLQNNSDASGVGSGPANVFTGVFVQPNVSTDKAQIQFMRTGASGTVSMAYMFMYQVL